MAEHEERWTLYLIWAHGRLSLLIDENGTLLSKKRPTLGIRHSRMACSQDKVRIPAWRSVTVSAPVRNGPASSPAGLRLGVIGVISKSASAPGDSQLGYAGRPPA